MGRTTVVSGDPIEALYRRLAALERRQGRRPTISLPVVSTSSYIPSDGDGLLWIDADDHTLRFQVNGTEFSIPGTAV